VHAWYFDFSYPARLSTSLQGRPTSARTCTQRLTLLQNLTAALHYSSIVKTFASESTKRMHIWRNCLEKAARPFATAGLLPRVSRASPTMSYSPTRAYMHTPHARLLDPCIFRLGYGLAMHAVLGAETHHVSKGLMKPHLLVSTEGFSQIALLCSNSA
jgi:hypothetical protein